jgi:hypothetical protein
MILIGSSTKLLDVDRLLKLEAATNDLSLQRKTSSMLLKH